MALDLPEPAALHAVPVEELPAILVRLAALQAAVAARLATVPATVAPSADDSDATVDVRGAARLLAMSPCWVYRHAAQLPFPDG
jgi:hypothetical protein